MADLRKRFQDLARKLRPEPQAEPAAGDDPLTLQTGAVQPLGDAQGAAPEPAEQAVHQVEVELSTGDSEVAAEAAAGDPKPERLGRYELLGLIGKGGMGEVLRVRDPVLKRNVAMKVVATRLLMRKDMLARFVEEAQATAQLQHPAIVGVYELGELPDRRLYFTMQEIHGKTLRRELVALHTRPLEERKQLHGTGRVTVWGLLEAFRRVCDAVAYAHSRGVLHRDIKPTNIMLGEFGTAYVLDWGIVKVMREASDLDAVATSRSAQGAHATRKGQVLGTPEYMAPEQAEGDIDRMGPPSDVYSLGVILFEIFKGRRPSWGLRDPAFRGGDTGLTPEPELPEGVVEILMKALAWEPAERYADAGAFGAAVGQWMAGAHS